MLDVKPPPGPTVLVTAAHCTFLCKSGGAVVDNCCCQNVGQVNCASDTNKCGSSPTVVEMSGMSKTEWPVTNKH